MKKCVCRFHRQDIARESASPLSTRKASGRLGVQGHRPPWGPPALWTVHPTLSVTAESQMQRPLSDSLPCGQVIFRGRLSLCCGHATPASLGCPLLLPNQPALQAGAALGSAISVPSTVRRARLCCPLPPREPPPRTAMAGMRQLPGAWSRPDPRSRKAQGTKLSGGPSTTRGDRPLREAPSLARCPGERDASEQEGALCAAPRPPPQGT